VSVDQPGRYHALAQVFEHNTTWRVRTSADEGNATMLENDRAILDRSKDCFPSVVARDYACRSEASGRHCWSLRLISSETEREASLAITRLTSSSSRGRA